MNTPVKHELRDGRRIEWRLPDGRLHQADGPALTLPSGSAYWFFNGKRHRDNGPAIIRPDGTTEYWLENIQYDPVTFLIKSYEYTS